MKPRSQAKQERLAQALRENLKRRKARSRALDKASPPIQEKHAGETSKT